MGILVLLDSLYLGNVDGAQLKEVGCLALTSPKNITYEPNGTKFLFHRFLITKEHVKNSMFSQCCKSQGHT